MRCKFKVDSIVRSLGSHRVVDADGKPVIENGYPKYVPTEMWSVTMSPVYANNDPEHENSRFWQATPSGEIKLGTVNKAAVDTLDLGMECYIDIVPVKK